MAIFEDIDSFALIISRAYESAFSDTDVLKQLQGQSVTLSVQFQQENVWWSVIVQDGQPVWRTGQVPNPDIIIAYDAARTFHLQFWDPQQFMHDALSGGITMSGSTDKALILQPLAHIFQTKYQELTREDAPHRIPPIL